MPKYRVAVIGRIEPVFDRRAGVLRVKGLWLEPNAPAGAARDVEQALDELAAWLGATASA